mmetsp:Transcript_26831/g.45262  ORF Transcript_26831/g.45262 Transcript_26831/m.45262 type:complete len:93 (+) Transcript_26831:129-407(+)
MFSYSRSVQSSLMTMSRCLSNSSGVNGATKAFKGRRTAVRHSPPHTKNFLLAGFLMVAVGGIYTVSIRKMSGQDDIDEILELEHHDQKKQQQ